MRRVNAAIAQAGFAINPLFYSEIIFFILSQHNKGFILEKGIRCFYTNMEFMMRYLSIIFILLSAIAHSSASAETACNSTYQASLNILTLDCVQVQVGTQTQTYRALFSLSTQQPPFYLTLSLATPLAAQTASECSARYDTGTGVLSIPCLKLQAGNSSASYRATLQSLPAPGGGMRFLLTDLASIENPPTPEPPAPQPAVPAEAHVLLLLHGMNSSELTWNDYISHEPVFSQLSGGYSSEKCPAIATGVIEGGAQLPATIPPLACYRLRFGAYDGLSGRTGLENIRANGPLSGDFSTFTQLGEEVKEAVAAIRYAYQRAYPDATVKVTLLAHSRGGIAAREFLQQASDSPEKQAVTALLTTGTPHYGSPLGRVYQYLKNNCTKSDGTRKASYFLGMAMDDCADDWQVVDTLKTGVCDYFIPGSDNTLDVRRPTIDDLSDKSEAIAGLDRDAYRLPGGISYGALRYTGVELGRLAQMYRIFDLAGADVCDQVSTTAQNYLLAPTGSALGENEGDGVVPQVSQNFPAGIAVKTLSNNPRREETFHTHEPTKQAHLSSALKEMLPNWGF